MMHSPVRKILLVDDEVIIVMGQAAVLKCHGFQVMTKVSGESAVEAVKNDPQISLVIMDIDLGKGIDGCEAARRILQIRKLPIIFMTSHSEREMVEKVRGITRYGYVLKNSGDFVLISAIEMAFELFLAHEKTLETEKRLELAQDAAQAGTWEWNLAEEEHFWSDSLWSLFGYEPGSCIPGYENWLKVIHPDDREAVMENIRMAALSTQEFNAEWRINNPSGSVRWLLSRGKPVRDSDGHGNKYVGIVLDITERKSMEERLRKSEEKYRSLFDNAQVGMYRTKLDGSAFLMANRYLADIFCCSMEELMAGTVVARYARAADREKMVKKLIEFRELRDYEIEILDVKGRIKTVMLAIRYYPEEACLEGSMLDITDRRKRDIDLQFRSQMMEMSFGGISIADVRGVLTYCNRAFLELWGFSFKEQAVGKKVGDLFNNPDDAVTILKELSAADQWEGDFIARRADGTTFTSHAIATSIRSEDGIFQGFQSVCIDVSANKKA